MPIPIKENSRNPLLNWQLNPFRNWQIDPSRNWQIDPSRNWQIDPSRNWQIDPSRNWQINPSRNWQINPARNWQIDPSRNWQVDPFRATFLKGNYVTRVRDLSCEYFAVDTPNSNVKIIYNSSGAMVYWAACANSCWAIYNMSFRYVGFLCPNINGGYHWFNLSKALMYILS